MVCAQVMGNHTTVSVAGSNGHFQLNVFKPVIIFNILQSILLLSDALISFSDNCVKGIEPNHDKIQQYLGDTLMLVTALNPVIGYDKASEIAKKAHKEGSTLKEAALALGYISEADFDQHIDPSKMV